MHQILNSLFPQVKTLGYREALIVKVKLNSRPAVDLLSFYFLNKYISIAIFTWNILNWQQLDIHTYNLSNQDRIFNFVVANIKS